MSSRQSATPANGANFAADLKVGQAYERQLADLLGGTMGGTTRDSGDIRVQTANGIHDCEIKLDERYDSTGNVAFEIADVHKDRMIGTGVGKQVGIGIPSFNIHSLGRSGEVIIYQAVDAFAYMEKESFGGFDRMVSVRNSVWYTVNLIVRPGRLVNAGVAERVYEDELEEYIRTLNVTSYSSRTTKEVRGVYVGMIEDAGNKSDSLYYNDLFELKSGDAIVTPKAQPMIVDVSRLPRRGSLTPHIADDKISAQATAR